ncbi:MAG: HD domain-containing protein [Deltaproteobacteria bacterium]|nr:HD domain-containing protein [Deltaproteobacteria bacterium]
MKPLQARDIEPRVCELLALLSRYGHEGYVVGGGVRDLLRGKPAKDWDVATSARPEEVMQRCKAARLHTVPTGLKHGTVTVLVGEPALAIEVTTYRGDGEYSDGRRPDRIEFVRTIEEDLARRDFTINALAYDPVADRLVDPYGGLADLEAGIIRAVGDAAARFGEDGLRTMRAVRFAATLEMALEPATQAAIPGALPVFRKVSAERVRDELTKLLGARRPSIGLNLMRDTGLLAEVLPELARGVGMAQNRFHAYDVFEHTVRAVDATPGDAITRLAALMHDVAKPVTAAPRDNAPGENSFFRHEIVGAELSDVVLRRLKFSTEERERVVAVVKNHMFWYSDAWSDGTVRRFLRRVGPERIPELFAVRIGDVVAHGKGKDPEDELGELRRRIAAVVEADQALKTSDLAIDGRDVMKQLGLPPSRRVGEVLEALLERVLDDPGLNTREGLEALLPEVLAQVTSASAGGGAGVGARAGAGVGAGRKVPGHPDGDGRSGDGSDGG